MIPSFNNYLMAYEELKKKLRKKQKQKKKYKEMRLKEWI